MDIIASNINIKDITETLKGLQNMCNSVQILYEAYAKGNTELTNLANISFISSHKTPPTSSIKPVRSNF